MMTAELLRNLSPERFTDVLGASPRQVREQLFRQTGVKAKSKSFAVTARGKYEEKARKLHKALADGAEPGEELLGEVIRNYFYTRRPLLAEALDLLEVPHNDGLTDGDLDFIAELPESRTAAIRETLEAQHDPEDVDIYLKFMNFPGA